MTVLLKYKRVYVIFCINKQTIFDTMFLNGAASRSVQRPTCPFLSSRELLINDSRPINVL